MIKEHVLKCVEHLCFSDKKDDIPVKVLNEQNKTILSQKYDKNYENEVLVLLIIK